MKLNTRELFCCNISYLASLFEKCEYPWEMLPFIKEYAENLIKTGIPGFTLYSEGVLVGKNVKIHPSAVISAPAIFGDDTEIRPGAYIRGSVITGRGCVIGNSTEVKNAILLDKVQIPHYNYVGDSILGNNSHMGAGAVCSNLKSDKREVVIHGDEDIQTGLRKIGGILADGADVGCGCVLNPGTVIGKNTNVYPLTSLRGVYPGQRIVKGTKTVVVKEER